MHRKGIEQMAPYLLLEHFFMISLLSFSLQIHNSFLLCLCDALLKNTVTSDIVDLLDLEQRMNSIGKETYKFIVMETDLTSCHILFFTQVGPGSDILERA